jgi:glycine/D-amino acid oxidase-like deaminating enzyme
MNKTIAILGAGFSGLAVAWELLNRSHQVHLFDPAGIGGGASGISAGLLHPFAGLHAHLNPMGREGVEATCHLLEVASTALGQTVATPSGMLRLAVTHKMAADFKASAALHEEISWLTPEECVEKVPGLAPHPGIWIQSAWTVRSPLYLQGLFLACQQLGAILLKEPVTSLSSLSSYDGVVIALGAATRSLPELSSLPLTSVKGQIVELAWPHQLPPLPFPLNSDVYLLPGQKSCIAGATFERQFSTPDPDPAIALNHILPKATRLLPALAEAPLLDCRAGIRASTPDHTPLLKQIDAKTWLLTGMGSKGLLYHALFARRLADFIQ